MKYSRRSKTRKSKRKPRRKLKRKTRRKLKRNTRSKRRRRQQRIQSKQRGGMFINLSQKNIKYLQDNPHEFKGDCCPCVFHFFGMRESLAKMLARKFKGGMQPYHISDVFKKAYPTTRNGRLISWGWLGFSPEYLGSAAVRPFIANIYNQLKNSQGVIGVTSWSGRGRTGYHCIIFAKDKDGTCLLIDAQQAFILDRWDDIKQYFIDQKVWHVSVLSGKDADGQRITIDRSGNLVDDTEVREQKDESRRQESRSREQKRLRANRDKKLNVRRRRNQNHPLNTILDAISPPVG